MSHDASTAVAAEGSQPGKAPAGSASRVFRDPVTGKFREPTEAELREMPAAGQGPDQLQSQSPQVIKQDHGVLMVPPNAETMYFATARRNENGEIETNCEPGQAAGPEQSP